MNIKNIIKNNFIAMVALATVLGFSAFKMTETKVLDSNWYFTDEDGILQPMAEAPEGDCNPDLPTGDECAVQTENPVAPETPRAALDPNEITNRAFKVES